MTLTRETLKLAATACTAIAEDPREPERYQRWYAEAAAAIHAELAAHELMPSPVDPLAYIRYPATRSVIDFYQHIHPGRSHRLQWVMNQTTIDQLFAEAKAANPDAYRPEPERLQPVDMPPPEPLPARMFGMPIRIDPNATTIMLELR